MSSRLPLTEMTIEEKLEEMEALWGDLSRGPLASPDWHGEVLRRRQTRVESGAASFIDWDQAKQQIRDAVQ